MLLKSKKKEISVINPIRPKKNFCFSSIYRYNKKEEADEQLLNNVVTNNQSTFSLLQSTLKVPCFSEQSAKHSTFSKS